MSQTNQVVLPILESDGSNLAVDICKEAIRQSEENLKKIEDLIGK